MISIARKKITQTHKLLGALTAGHLVNDFYSSTLPFLLPALIVTFDLSFFEAGLLTIATSLLSGFLQPVIGYLADIYARRKMTILLGFSAFSLGLLIASSSISYPMLLAAFFVYGLGQATFHAQSTNLITRSFPRSRGRSMGIHGIGGSIGHFSAPIIATLLITALSWRYATSLLALPGLIIIVFLGYILFEPPKAQKMARGTPIISGKLLVLTLTIGLIYMAYIGFITFLPTYLVENGSSLTQAGFIAATMFFVGVLAQPAGGFIHDKLGGRLLFASSSLLSALGLWFFTLENNVPSIIFVIIIGAAVQATYPVSLAMGSELAKGENVGVSVGFVFGISGVMASIAPALTGYAADSFGLQVSLRLLVILVVIALAVSFFLPSRQPDS